MLICSCANIVLQLELLFWLPDAHPNVFIEPSLSLHFAKLSKINTLIHSQETNSSFLIILHLCPIGFIFLPRDGEKCPLSFSQGLPRFFVRIDALLSWGEGTGVTKVPHFASAFSVNLNTCLWTSPWPCISWSAALLSYQRSAKILQPGNTVKLDIFPLNPACCVLNNVGVPMSTFLFIKRILFRQPKGRQL